MRAKLDGEAGRAVYARRKAIVDPVFGQAREIRLRVKPVHALRVNHEVPQPERLQNP